LGGFLFLFLALIIAFVIVGTLVVLFSLLTLRL
jgi:hypothetical protein